MEWRDCVGFPDYQVSECGDVRRGVGSRTRRQGWRLRGFINGDGYISYALIDANRVKHLRPAHRLVAEAFIGPAPGPEYEVAHNNGSRLSNHFSNLRWATRKENDEDTVVHGTARVGEQNGNAKLTAADVQRIRETYLAIKERAISKKVSDLAREFGIHHGTVVRICRGQAWGRVR